MIFRATKSVTIYSSWKKPDPKKITRHLVEIGYELSSRFETIYFLQVWRWSFMVDVFDEDAAAAVREIRMIDCSIPPPPVMVEAPAPNIVKFPRITP